MILIFDFITKVNTTVTDLKKLPEDVGKNVTLFIPYVSSSSAFLYFARNYKSF